MPGNPCSKCGGQGVTDREEHTVELDEHGNQVPVIRHSTQQCDMCGGTGEAK